MTVACYYGLPFGAAWECCLKGPAAYAVDMAKYSTGRGGGGGDGDACELCGATSESLRTANIAGATLQVCESCRPHDDADRSSKPEQDESSGDREPRRKELARRIAKAQDAAKPDTSRWEREGAGYEDDPLPYLVPGYGDQVTEARQAAGMKLEELADELDIPERELLAVEQGRATRAGIGGSVIDRLEDHLDIALKEDT